MPETSAPILIAVPADVKAVENYHWHASPDTYLKALIRVAKAVPLIVPALSDEFDIEAVLERVDGVMLTGSASNVHPDRYGVPPSVAHEPFDPERDRLTERLIRSTLDRGLPLLCICRGHQELNVIRMGGNRQYHLSCHACHHQKLELLVSSQRRQDRSTECRSHSYQPTYQSHRQHDCQHHGQVHTGSAGATKNDMWQDSAEGCQATGCQASQQQ